MVFLQNMDCMAVISIPANPAIMVRGSLPQHDPFPMGIPAEGNSSSSPTTNTHIAIAEPMTSIGTKSMSRLFLTPLLSVVPLDKDMGLAKVMSKKYAQLFRRIRIRCINCIMGRRLPCSIFLRLSFGAEWTSML